MSEPSFDRRSDRSSPDESAVVRFERSLLIGYEQWHDGVGYDVEALAIIASLGSDSARTELRRVAMSGSSEVRLAVLQHAPELVPDDARIASIVQALESATPFDSFTETLDQVEAFHPQPVIDALWQGLESRAGDVAVHYAAMLAFVYGKADSSFDWSMRPLFLKFNTADVAQRRAAVSELRARIA